MAYYLAVDIGASSGRHILANVENGRIGLEEIYRFPNGQRPDADGMLVWDTDALFSHVVAGIAKCAEIGKIPVSVGIDTWGVDFVLIDAEGNRVGKTVGYRDARTEKSYETIDALIPPEEMYARTGLQRQNFNTVCQLVAVKRDHPEWLERADALLMMADYLQFRLTGVKVCDYTNASTTQLLDGARRDWDRELIAKLALPEKIFLPLSMPGRTVGSLKDEIAEAVGFNCKVVLPPTHDTASAVAAVPGKGENVLYLSSGTWSLIGTELAEPISNEAARSLNWTNEGGYGGSIRFLKNIMGLWMIQEIKREFDAAGEVKSWNEIESLAETSRCDAIVDCDDSAFFAPRSMCQAIAEKVGRDDLTLGDYARIVYRSLAARYARACEELEHITGRRFDTLNIVGGGSKNGYLNRLTAQACARTVLAGPTEGTAIGNLLVQMIANGDFTSLADARDAVRESFDIVEFRE